MNAGISISMLFPFITIQLWRIEMSNFDKTSQKQIPVLPVLPKEVLDNGLTQKYLSENGNQLKVTIKPYADKSYDIVSLKFGEPPRSFTVNAGISSSGSDTVVIFTANEIREVGDGDHLMDYVLVNAADNNTSPRSPSQKITVKGM
ncbi:hypothetical protein ACYZT8_15240 [Pseudomonas sp. LB3P93]|jgi:hypothetical protein